MHYAEKTVYRELSLEILVFRCLHIILAFAIAYAAVPRCLSSKVIWESIINLDATEQMSCHDEDDGIPDPPSGIIDHPQTGCECITTGATPLASKVSADPISAKDVIHHFHDLTNNLPLTMAPQWSAKPRTPPPKV